MTGEIGKSAKEDLERTTKGNTGGTHDGNLPTDEEERFDSDRDGQNINEIEPGDGG